MVKFETLLIVSGASETWFNSNISTEKKNETNEKRERERETTQGLSQGPTTADIRAPLLFDPNPNPTH